MLTCSLLLPLKSCASIFHAGLLSSVARFASDDTLVSSAGPTVNIISNIPVMIEVLEQRVEGGG